MEARKNGTVLFDKIDSKVEGKACSHVFDHGLDCEREAVVRVDEIAFCEFHIPRLKPRKSIREGIVRL